MVSSSNDNLLTQNGSGWLEDVNDDLLIEIVPFKRGWDSSGRNLYQGRVLDLFLIASCKSSWLVCCRGHFWIGKLQRQFSHRKGRWCCRGGLSRLVKHCKGDILYLLQSTQKVTIFIYLFIFCVFSHIYLQSATGRAVFEGLEHACFDSVD